MSERTYPNSDKNGNRYGSTRTYGYGQTGKENMKKDFDTSISEQRVNLKKLTFFVE